MTSVIETSGLTKLYGGSAGINSLTLAVNAGEIFGYLGPNGAGKTTTIRLMLGFIRPDKGSLKIFGKPVTPASTKDRTRIGFVPGEAALPEGATAHFLLNYYAKLSRADCSRRGELCERLGLGDREMRKSIRSLSRGTKQKVAIIQALQHKPELLILDEPTTGLDPLSQEAFFDILHDMRDQGSTVFFSSHILSEVQRLCDRVAVLRDGKLVLESTMVEMAAQADRLLWIKLPAPPGDLSDAPQHPSVAGAQFIRVESGGWLLYLARKGEARGLLNELHRLQPLDFRFEPALEESFLELYGVQVKSPAKGEIA